jgi:rRNA-processing protein FCF1
VKSNSTVAEMQVPPVAPPRLLHDLSALALMLADGWRIEAPVLARLSWAQRHTGDLAYHVILTRAAQRSLIVIAEDPDLHRFLAEQSIPVI